MIKAGAFKHIFRFGLAGLIICGLTMAVAALNPQKASADACSINGRDCYYGYFFNGYDGGAAANGTRHNLLRAPAVLNVNNGFDLVTTMKSDLEGCPGNAIPNPNDQDATGAAFIVLTMLGAAPGTDKNVACQRFDEWASHVYNYEASGLINFNQIYDFGGINTRSTYTDVAYYPQNGSAPSIVFYSPTTGQPIYAIKKDCGNPVGRLQTVTPAYNLTPSINATVNGTTSTGVAETGDTISFTFNVNNSARTDSDTVNCNAANVNHTGYFKTPASPEGGGSAIGIGCPRAFGRNSTTTVATQTITAPANTTVCRTLFVNPSSPGGPSKGIEVCVVVANKPYLMVFGGDVATGGDVESAPSTCSSNANASIVSWNQGGGAAAYAGAGAQYAAYATGIIKEFSTAQRSPAGGAGMPGGLSFSSTTQSGNIYGGSFGTSKCIKDYYGHKPASTTSMPPNVSAMTTGSYAATASTVLNGGNVNPGQKTAIYVDGDLFINSNITYVGSWSYNTIPSLQVIVRGNIFIGSGVTRLDGMYVAQPTGAANGYVYTCATDSTPPFSPPVLTAGAFYSSCTNKLTVNGSVVARSIQFLRTSGTLRNATTADNRASNGAAESFSYGPGFWITQPDLTTNNGGTVDNYDAITSLPPVL